MVTLLTTLDEDRLLFCSEYAEMFGSLDNQLSNVSDSYIGDKCPSPSKNAEANDGHCMAPIEAENGILSMEESIQNENEKQEESISCTKDVRPEEIVADAGNLDVSKSELRDENVDDEALVEENSSINTVGVIVDETLPVTSVVSSEQNLDSKNDTQTAENTECSVGAGLDSHPKEELNFSASSQISEEIKEVPKKVDAKVESDGILVEQQKQSVVLVTSSMENDAESDSLCEEEQKRTTEEKNRNSNSTSSSPSKSMTETDKSKRSRSRDKNNKMIIFKGICYRFLSDACCRCRVFSHKFPPHFMQRMESSTSLDIYNTLLFAINNHLSRFLTSFGTACASILSSRKEGNFLMGFLTAYANEFKGNARFWNVILRHIIDCGNCCESSSLEIIMHIVKHILSDQGLPENMYRSLVGNIMAITCNFKDINRVCIVLDSLEFRGVSLQQCTVRKLLQLIHFACTEADRSRISYKIASALVVAYFLISQEDRELFCAMYEVLKRNGQEGLVEELERKSTTVSNDLNPQNDSHVAQLENSTEVTPRKMSRQSSMGLQSQGKKFRRISETEADTLVPSKRARVSSGPFAMQDFRRRGSSKNSYLTGNDLLRRQSSGAYSQHLESQYLSIEHQPSSSSMSSAFPSWSPVHQYGPNDVNERDRRDFEAAFSAPLTSPLPTSAHGCSLFPPGVRSKPNDPVNKSLPSSSLNEPSYKYWHSTMKKEDGKQSFLPNASRGLPRLIPDKCISPSIGKGFSKFGDPSAETKRFRNCSSPVMRNTPSTANSDDTSGSLIEQNVLEQPSSSSAISLSHLQKKPDSSSEKVLEEAFKKSKWSPGMVLSAFSPWLNTPKRQVQLSKLSCKILEQDFTKSAVSLKALLHCLGSQELRSNKKFDDIKKILSTVIFNLILRMVISDAWSDAYKFLRMASSANLPIFLAEAFIEEEMSISRKFLVLSEVCFRVNAMDEAIGYLNKGNLFGPVTCWKYPYLDGDLEIQVTFLSSLLSKLASGGFSETAPSIFMTIYTAQKGFYRPVDLTVHVNKVILCALNGSCIKQAYEVYNTLLTSAVRLPKTTYRALLIGLVSNQKYLLARNLYLEVCGLDVYPSFKENEILHEITVYSYWQKEEIFIILDNAIRIMYENEVKTNRHKEIQDLEMNIHIEVSDTPEDLSVPWIPLKDDGNEDCQDLIPHSLALTSNTLEEAHDRVSYVLEQMFIPPILFDCIVTKEELEELFTLHPDSLEAHIYERFYCDS
ncbi:hypothetical protein J437_LFUL008133 [Ladona fulva]|uniref:Protein TOPAZ1 n=1 Tax=Ladona fulva TaxID=123851 RepID=A0A8K0JU72_LADFU|nr:hypothetical protein J437_LFUL008133 [Ladona fulva]